MTRVIYTQGAVRISGLTGIDGFEVLGAGGMYLSGVQSSNFSATTPSTDVNAFGTLGSINRVQLEPSTATLEVTLVVNSGNVTLNNGWLSGLVKDTLRANPSGVTVTASGIGQVTGAILTSFNMEMTVGNLPQLSLSFEGVSGAAQTAPAAPSMVNTATVPVVQPDSFGTIYWAGASPTLSGCPQTVRASWEMPVERLNCLGSPINSPTIFSRPPGTISFTAEGVDNTLGTSLASYLSGVQIGPYKLSAANVRETSRTANMAVGDASATFNVTSEGTALNGIVAG